MNKNLVTDILEDIQDEVFECKVIYNYSGRGMVGKECLAVSTPNPINIVEKAAVRGLVGARVDSLGYESVVYWPKYNAESTIS
jgi:hypothetical protein